MKVSISTAIIEDDADDFTRVVSSRMEYGIEISITPIFASMNQELSPMD